jgi:MFS family permease
MHKQTIMMTASSPSVCWKGVVLIFLAPAIGSFLYGYELGTGSSSIMLNNKQLNEPTVTQQTGRLPSQYDDFFLTKTYQRDDDVENEDYYRNAKVLINVSWWNNSQYTNTFRQNILFWSMPAGALFVNHLLVFHLAPDKVSRLMELRMAAVLFFIRRVFMLLRLPFGCWLFVVGRFVCGIGVGLVMHSAPIYIAEMSPASIRGGMMSALEIMMALGAFVGHVLRDNAQSVATYIDLTILILSIAMLRLTFAIPRSTRWLIARGLEKEAKMSLRFVYSGDAMFVYREIDDNLKWINRESTEALDSHDNRFLHRQSLRWYLSTSISRTSIILILCGQIFKQPAIVRAIVAELFLTEDGNRESVVVSSMSAIAMTMASCFTAVMVDCIGRKRILLISCFVMLISSVLLACLFWQDSFVHTSLYHKFIISGIFSYIVGYQLGFGSIAWLLVSEMLPQHVRGSSLAGCIELSLLLSFLFEVMFPFLLHWFGWRIFYWMLAAMQLWATAYTLMRVPETAGLILEQTSSLQQKQHYLSCEKTSRQCECECETSMLRSEGQLVSHYDSIGSVVSSCDSKRRHC